MRIKPKKKLGQNFLVDKNIQRKIIDCLELRPTDIVLEIGAGNGELTALLARKAKKVYALEIDPSLCRALRERLEGHSNIEIINRDVLKFDLKEYLRSRKEKGKVTVVGNIPYYISSPIISRLVKFRKKINAIFLTLQKEFAARIASPCGSKEYGSFSCFVQYYARPEILFAVGKNCFFPAPKVDSCFLRLGLKQKLPLSPKREKLLFRISRAAFNQRRKTLRNSLKGLLLPQKLGRFFARYNIDPDTRPDGLSWEDFARLSQVT